MPTVITGTDGINQVQAGAVESGDLASGAIGSGDLPAGSVIQVVSATKTDTFSALTTSYVEVPGLTATITPNSSSSKILVLGSLTRSGGESGVITEAWTFFRNSTNIVSTGIHGISYEEFSANAFTENASGQILDFPNTTSAITYSIRIKGDTTARSIFVNRAAGRSANAASTITVMEIAG